MWNFEGIYSTGDGHTIGSWTDSNDQRITIEIGWKDET